MEMIIVVLWRFFFLAKIRTKPNQISLLRSIMSHYDTNTKLNQIIARHAGVSCIVSKDFENGDKLQVILSREKVRVWLERKVW